MRASNRISESAIEGAMLGRVVLLRPAEPSAAFSIASSVSRRGCKCAYISVERPLPQAREHLQRHKADLKLFNLADAASMRAGLPLERSLNVAYAYSPRDFEEISLAIDACTSGYGAGGVLFFDSLSSMFLYNDPRRVVRFAAAMASKLRERKVGMVMTVAERHPIVHADLVSLADRALGFEDAT